MKILVTGAKGFVGKNLISLLRTRQNIEILEFDVDSSKEELQTFCAKCSFVFHLAGVNRPLDPAEFMKGNCGFTSHLITALENENNCVPIVATSSIQADLDNDYGKSKKAEEDLLFAYNRKHQVPIYIYRLINLFGKWCRPNYNSVTATFCYNIARHLPIKINDPEKKITLCYIDDVIAEFERALKASPTRIGSYCVVKPDYTITIAELAKKIYSFQEVRVTLNLPNLNDDFTRKLYATYLSYLPESEFKYSLCSHVDKRGSFTEFIHTLNSGQISINISKPHSVKGNHWHNTKNEKFLVVYGSGVVRFRQIGSRDVITIAVCGNKLEVVEIPIGYTHNIENIGESDMVTIMWASETYNSNQPDTFYEEV